MLEDRDLNVVYVPVSAGLIAELEQRGWSEPVQIRFERDPNFQLQLVVRKVEPDPV